MTTITNPYAALYTNLKNSYTVIHEGTECTIADYLLAKAGRRKANSSLPAKKPTYERSVITSLVDYVSDKLTLKDCPKKDSTIKSFPLRTSFSALLSSVAACALVLSCGIFAILGNNISSPILSNNEDSSYVSPEVTPEVEEFEDITVENNNN